MVFAGSPEQVRQVVESAAPFQEELVSRGVLLVPVPCYGDGGTPAAEVPPLGKDDLRRVPCFTILPPRMQAIRSGCAPVLWRWLRHWQHQAAASDQG